MVFEPMTACSFTAGWALVSEIFHSLERGRLGVGDGDSTDGVELDCGRRWGRRRLGRGVLLLWYPEARRRCGYLRC